jgi:hypothetical protein
MKLRYLKTVKTELQEFGMIEFRYFSPLKIVFLVMFQNLSIYCKKKTNLDLSAILENKGEIYISLKRCCMFKNTAVVYRVRNVQIWIRCLQKC